MLGGLLLSFLPWIAPSDPRIVYVGRFDWQRPDAPACQWSASEVRLRVRGAALTVRMEETGADRWQVVVDGQAGTVLAPPSSPSAQTIRLGKGGEHEVRLVKRTEPSVGTTRFLGFATPSGALLKAQPKRRHIEFIGDSITCGYGNEAKSADEPFRPATENAYLSYASIAARAVDADPTLIAWWGRRIGGDNTMPELYDRILPTQPHSRYGFRGPAPDAVIIHLGTNDFFSSNPPEGSWTRTYEAFIRRVWSHYPKAHVYAAIGSIMTDANSPGRRPLSTIRRYIRGMVQRMHDRRLHLVEFAPQRAEDGIGAISHPSVKTHRRMAAVLTAALRRDLGW